MKLNLFFAGFLIFIFICCSKSDDYKSYQVSIPTNKGIIGIDVSHYQNKINWSKVKKFSPNGLKISFVFIKATESSQYIDPAFQTHWQHTFDLGFKRGAYHFFHPDEDVIAQAKHFLNHWKPDSYSLPPVLDIEKITNLKPLELKKKIKIWMEYVKKESKIQPILYTYKHYFEQNELYDLHYPIWIAAYQNQEPQLKRHEWKFWQFSEKARVSGIQTPVDLNIFAGDSTNFDDWCKRMIEKVK